MEEKKDCLILKNYPENLDALLQNSNWQEDWTVVPMYYLVVVHDCMGQFPAIVKSDRRRILTADKALIKSVWRNLSPCFKSKLCRNLFYVHKTEPVCYQNFENNFSQYAEPEKVFLKEELQPLLSENQIRWAPGIAGMILSQESFFKMIDKAFEIFEKK